MACPDPPVEICFLSAITLRQRRLRGKYSDHAIQTPTARDWKIKGKMSHYIANVYITSFPIDTLSIIIAFLL